jgi:hypothetical protein
MNTLDSIRAAFNASAVETATNANVALLGYSGGAIASEWAAELAPTYAPDVNARLIGAAIGGVWSIRRTTCIMSRTRSSGRA